MKLPSRTIDSSADEGGSDDPDREGDSFSEDDDFDGGNVGNQNKTIIGRKKQERPLLRWKIWEKEKEQWIDENEDKDGDLDHLEEDAGVAEAPSDLILPLLRYQKEWLAWALKQEDSHHRGGILADEMGMGKTIQAVALVMAKRAKSSTNFEAGMHSFAPTSSTDLPEIKCTLVVCPIVAVMQWKNEIAKYTREGSTKVLIYHGGNAQFCDYDFVLTTYSTLMAEYKKHVMQPKEEVDNIELKNEYGINSSEKDPASPEQSPLVNNSVLHCHSVNWARIILDEAHCIKGIRSNTAKAIFSLKSSFKWALIGTPLQDCVSELHSLVCFLEITPYSYFLCRDCDCIGLDSFYKNCPSCPHKSGRHICWFYSSVVHPMLPWSDQSKRKRAIILLKHKVLKGIMLRRTKKGKATDLALPPKIVILRRDSLDPREENYYKDLYNQKYKKYTTFNERYAHLLDLLTRLRQAVDHPYLVHFSDDPKCRICSQPAVEPAFLLCWHIICEACLLGNSDDQGQITCPSCGEQSVDRRSKPTVKGFRSSNILKKVYLEDFQTSTKIEALREEIRFMVERDRSAKGIVFSHFTSFLDLICYALQESGVLCIQFRGSMTINAQDAAIKKFINDPECKIFLMTLKAGDVALNLNVASHVFMMDPWWNPAVEHRALDRIHWIGEYKPIRIVKFIIKNTVEEKMMGFMQQRELDFKGGYRNVAEKLIPVELEFLFQDP